MPSDLSEKGGEKEVKKDIIICGVGGQGIILLSKILSMTALEEGLEVKLSEVHGMSQRGGSVYTMVRMGRKVFSPLIPQGEADFILSLEKLETLRWLPYLKEGGEVLINDYEIQPLPLILERKPYPEVESFLKKSGVKFELIPALKMAKATGNVKVVNIILLGRLAKKLSFNKSAFEKSIRRGVKPQFVEVNLKAFHLGWGGESDGEAALSFHGK
jgi:indolepyruvate ferredoxin oxidoreductase beta subunit